MFDAAAGKASGISRKTAWQEAFAGEMALRRFSIRLPEDTPKEIARGFRAAMDAMMTAPVGGGAGEPPGIPLHSCAASAP